MPQINNPSTCSYCWKDVVEQPIEITARIPIKRKAPVVTSPRPRITPKMARLPK